MILDCWIKSKTKQNFKRKFIVDSLRLLHKKILYFEIGSKQVANNGNNFCNKHILERLKNDKTMERMAFPKKHQNQQTRIQ